MNKLAIVTGGSRGIGAAIVKHLAKKGFDIIIVSRKPSSLDTRLKNQCEEYGVKLTFIACDLSEYENIHILLTELDSFIQNGLDVLVNNAGSAELGPLTTISNTSVFKQATINFLTPALLIKHLQKSLATRNGTIINISSINASSPVPNSATYCSSKAALEMLTKSLAPELGRDNIRINAVAPGCTDTDLLREVTDKEIRRQIAAATPLGGLGQPEGIAEVVSFLCDENSRWITGEIIRVSGGLR